VWPAATQRHTRAIGGDRRRRDPPRRTVGQDPGAIPSRAGSTLPRTNLLSSRNLTPIEANPGSWAARGSRCDRVSGSPRKLGGVRTGGQRGLGWTPGDGGDVGPRGTSYALLVTSPVALDQVEGANLVHVPLDAADPSRAPPEV
jgi:hypothetical protein